MHTHIVINMDVGLYFVVKTKESDPDLSEVISELILREICHAKEGIQE